MTNVLNAAFNNYAAYLANHFSAGVPTFLSTTITYNIEGLLDNPAQYAAAQTALKLWGAATGLSFVQVKGAVTANIDFSNSTSGSAFTNWTTGHATVTVASDWMAGFPVAQQWGIGSYGLQTFIHEIGHALGLAHGGPYDGNGTYANDRVFDIDTWQYSVMSYFEQPNYTANHASFAYLNSPMLADIAAIRALYGSLAVNAANTAYGAGSTAMAGVTDFGRYAHSAFAIHDTGGYDTFNLSNATASSLIDLRPGFFSNINGLIGNVGIAVDTVIEKAIGTAFADTIYGNSANNTLLGNGGNDTMIGLIGNDVFDGGLGNDTIYGGVGNDSLNGNLGNDILRGGAGNDIYYINSALDLVDELADGGAGIDTIYSALSYSLVFTRVVGQVEALVLTGTGNLNATGNGIANTLIGNAGNNLLYGGLGNDTLIGGAGRDTFVFNTRPSTVSNHDNITDFSSVADTIYLENAIFTKLGAAGTVRLANFVNDLSGVAHDANDYLIYEKDTGKLFYDSNGSVAGESQLIATLLNKAIVTLADFFVI